MTSRMLQQPSFPCMYNRFLACVETLHSLMLVPMQENDVEREFQIHRTEEDYALAEFWKWTLAFLIGVTMGCIGFIVDWGIETLNNFKYYHTVGVIASKGNVEHTLQWCPCKSDLHASTHSLSCTSLSQFCLKPKHPFLLDDS